MRIAVLTTGRQDWGILRSTCVALRDDARFALSLWSGGMHESADFGATVKDVVEAGFVVDEHLDWLSSADMSGVDQAGGALALVGRALAQRRPEALLLVGDRLETAGAALASTLERIPIVHLHGGEETEGAFDNALRHAITKMSHLHLVSHFDHAARVRAMGEDPAHIHVVGAPGLDNLQRSDLSDRAELELSLGLPLKPPVVIVTLHPATLGIDPRVEAEAVVAAMDAVPATYVITLPNSDPGGATTRAVLLAAAQAPRRIVAEALGERRYWGLMRIADAMLGNSSSALLEAPAVGLPAVNVGNRQRGRRRGASVIDVDADATTITNALRLAVLPETKARLHVESAQGEGSSAQRILAVLAAWQPPSPPSKRFFGSGVAP